MNLAITRHNWTTRAEATKLLRAIVPGSGVLFFGTSRQNIADICAIEEMTDKFKTCELDGGVLVTPTKRGSQDLVAVIRVSQGGDIFPTGNAGNRKKYASILGLRLCAAGLIAPNPDGSFSVTYEGLQFIAAGGDWKKMPRAEFSKPKTDVRYFSIRTD